MAAQWYTIVQYVNNNCLVIQYLSVDFVYDKKPAIDCACAI